MAANNSLFRDHETALCQTSKAKSPFTAPMTPANCSENGGSFGERELLRR
jgi:hypothetical protein